MALHLPCAAADLEGFFEGGMVDSQQAPDADCGDLLPLYHLIDERLGDAKVLGDFRNVQKPIIPDGRICSPP